jgi:hypothetical protein
MPIHGFIVSQKPSGAAWFDGVPFFFFFFFLFVVGVRR